MQVRKLYSTATITFFQADVSSELKLPYVVNGISAGFPSPADDFLDINIDLNKHLIKNPSTTFYGRVRGDSMKDAGIHDGDLLIIDKSLEPTNNKIAVCFIDGEFTVKRISIEKDVVWLIAENKNYEPIKVTKDNDLVIWGIVTTVIKNL
ncbi:MAG: peptidase S24 [Xanthomarina sp.]|uniref:LexA family protein n=1 Tax=Xanthomarina sp. TaxID=1931211 RepID=UPI000C5E0CF4|nr:translesion error-prone DNA polymerase V autoproteolytic subunit [Xanthomarina sp.]MAL23189.1 peptidase S24 [Xanthomarina sp.]MBF60634.1 peptidase S24 [Xanthomarina sp.]HAB27868.1 peptidase S24 [Xanthomarina gelatinilytica]HAI19810.1 peptidase S24 [Xanthomarina gelatinilytica]|tara:strand:+ start:151 stop:600 length:450 start_codon:yes stop_codon:yes gene_type:complete